MDGIPTILESILKSLDINLKKATAQSDHHMFTKQRYSTFIVARVSRFTEPRVLLVDAHILK